MAVRPEPLCDYLRKQGGTVRNWKRRWFQVEGSQLFYYKTRGDRKAVDHIPLTHDTVIEPASEDDARILPGSFTVDALFHVRTPTRTYHLLAEVPEVRNKWVDFLRAQLAWLYPASLNSSVPVLMVSGAQHLNDARSELTKALELMNKLDGVHAQTLGDDWKTALCSVERALKSVCLATPEDKVTVDPAAGRAIPPSPRGPPPSEDLATSSPASSSSSSVERGIAAGLLEASATPMVEEQEEVGGLNLSARRRGAKNKGRRHLAVNDGTLFANPRRRSQRLTTNVIWHRRKVEEEIIKTELDYVTSLKQIVTYFLLPLRQCVKDRTLPGLKEKHLKGIFSNLETLLDLNRALLAKLDVAYRNALEMKPYSLGEVFQQTLPTFKPYQEYITNIAVQKEQLETWMFQKPFSDFLDKQLAKLQEDSGGSPSVGYNKNVGLPNFLIMPLQRIPRYVLLLGELLKHTPVAHEDWLATRSALTQAKDLADLINKSRTQTEHMEKLMEIQKSLAGDFLELVEPHRKFILEGPLLKLWEPDAASQESYFFLFNDLIVFAQEEKKLKSFFRDIAASKLAKIEMRRFQYESFFLISDCTAVHDAEVSGEHAFTLMVRSGKNEREFRLGAFSKKEKDQWVECLSEQIKNSSTEQVAKNDFLKETTVEGWLFKRPKDILSPQPWKKRWCRLKGSTLFYFEDYKVAKPLGSIDVSCYQIALPARTDRENTFELRHPTNRTYFFSVDEAGTRGGEALKSWLVAFDDAAHEVAPELKALYEHDLTFQVRADLDLASAKLDQLY